MIDRQVVDNSTTKVHSKQTTTYHRLWPYLIVFTLLTVVLYIELYSFAKTHDVIFLVSLCIILFAASTTYALRYVFSYSKPLAGVNASFIQTNRYEFGLILVIFFTTLPLLIKPYFYYDDWTLVGNPYFPCKENMIILGRPIQVLFFATLDKVDISNAFIFKWVYLFAIILYSLVLYRWIFTLTRNEKLAFFVSGILTVFVPMMDLLGYTSVGMITYSILFSALSVIAFDRAYEASRRREVKTTVIHTGISILLLFTACLTYQLGPQIIFLLLVIELLLSKEPRLILKKDLMYLLVFAFSFGFYLLFIGVMTKINHFQIISDRSQIVNSVEQLIGKFHFYQQVFKQSIMQVGTALSGNAFLSERYHGYYISYNNVPVGTLFYYFTIIVIILGLFDYLQKTKCILGLMGLVVYLPMSYFSFLLLAESEYLTVYAFSHISILMLFFIMGLMTIIKYTLIWIQRISSRTKPLIFGNKIYMLLLPILILCAGVANNYVRNFYINFNTQVYAYVKGYLQSALESSDVERIHIAGLISPINADVYSVLVVQTALTQLGENYNDYEITYSKNNHYLARIEEDYYLSLLGSLSLDDIEVLETFYTFEPTYSQYTLVQDPSPEEELLLDDIFLRSGAIPNRSTQSTLLIDLAWTMESYYNDH